MPTSNSGPESSDAHGSFVGFLKDNLEAIAVAVIMALVIKHFCVEAFKIPTSSMTPTLLGEGDAYPRSPGDRILVDKFAYLFSDPQRWDVIVFRYPLDYSRNFIKRIAGLPGERLRISRDGDIWVRPLAEPPSALKIAQKPRRVRERFYRRVYPPAIEGDHGEDAAIADDTADPRGNLDRYFRVEDGPPNAWQLERHGLFVFSGGPRGELRNAPRIRDETTAGDWAFAGSAGMLVRDLRVRFRVRLPEDGADSSPATRVSMAWHPDDTYQAVLTLSTVAGESRAFVRRGAVIVGEQVLEGVLEPGRAEDYELEYVDGVLRVHVDGEERAAIPDGRTFSETRNSSNEQGLTLAAEGGGLSIEDLGIDRDQHYINDWSGNARGGSEGVDVPPESYFMLGDNTRNSSDSRRWQLSTVTLGSGREIRYESGKETSLGRDARGRPTKEAVDADGIRRTWYRDDEDDVQTDPAPFVHRDLVVGRAFLVFWPCFPDFPGRLGLIH
jgi:signal peptidase I